MASSDSMIRLKEIVQCAICQEDYTDPRQLECEHAFCFECIATHFRIRGKNCAPCPTCRRNYWPKHRDPNNLPQPLTIRQLLDINHPSDRVCEMSGCNQNEAPYLCLMCRHWLCGTCKSQMCSAAKSSHSAFIKTEIDPGLFDIVKRGRHKRCYMHHFSEVEWYCQQCRMLICKLCQTNSHLHHTLIDIAEQSRDTRANLEHTVTLLKEKQQEHRHDLKMYKKLQTFDKVEIFDARDCQRLMTMCSRDIKNCDNIILMLTQLSKFGSDMVTIHTFQNLEERIQTELGQCHSLGPLLTELNSRMTDRNSGMDTSVDCCRNDQQKHVPCDSDKGHISSLGEGLDNKVPLEENLCQIPNCVSSKKAKFVCLTCMKLICDACAGGCCDRTDSNSKHEVLPVADIDRLLYNVIMRNKNHACKLHPTNDISLFCEECNIPLCTTCRLNSHLDHRTTKISDRSQKCCRKLRRYEEKLQKQVQVYKTTKQKFLEMQKSQYAKALSSSYCEDIASRFEAGREACEDFIKRIIFLHHYGSPSVIVDEFAELNYQIENELSECPSTPLRQLADFITDSLDQMKIAVQETRTQKKSKKTQESHMILNKKYRRYRISRRVFSVHSLSTLNICIFLRFKCVQK